jgi:hypothetical protein
VTPPPVESSWGRGRWGAGGERWCGGATKWQGIDGGRRLICKQPVGSGQD